MPLLADYLHKFRWRNNRGFAWELIINWHNFYFFFFFTGWLSVYRDNNNHQLDLLGRACWWINYK